MYNTSNATINNDEFISSYMPVGINENINVKEATIKTSPQGKDFLEIVFVNNAGQEAKMSVWKNEKNQWIKTDEELQQRDNAQFGQMMQILNCFYESIPDTTLNTFKDMITWVKSMIDPKLAEKKALRLKVIYDNKGYTKVSTNGIFVEPMSVTESQIKLFKRDTLERPVQADVEKPADPFASTGTSVTTETKTENPDGLPF